MDSPDWQAVRNDGTQVIDMPEELAIQPINRGWIPPGQTRNPGGRPKSAKVISDELSKLLHKGNAVKIAHQLIYLSLNAKQEAVRAKVSEMILDRMEGKPMQAIQVSQTLDENTAKRLVDIGSMLQRILPSQVETIPCEIVGATEQANVGENTHLASDIASPENAPAKRKYVRSGKYVGVNKRRKSKDVKNMRELPQPKAKLTYEYTVSTGVTTESTDPTGQSAG